IAPPLNAEAELPIEIDARWHACYWQHGNEAVHLHGYLLNGEVEGREQAPDWSRGRILLFERLRRHYGASRPAHRLLERMPRAATRETRRSLRRFSACQRSCKDLRVSQIGRAH